MTKSFHTCKECDAELKDNAEQSIHYNKQHRGLSYESLYTGEIEIVEEKKDNEVKRVLSSKLDKQVR